jgi:hypothetical protein
VPFRILFYLFINYFPVEHFYHIFLYSFLNYILAMKFRLDPFPRVSETLLNSFLNARILIFSIVVAKIMLDRLYKYAVVKYLYF